MNTQTHDIHKIAGDLCSGYDQLEPLGQGGMGDLFKGRKISLDVPVVVKVIKANLKGRLDQRQEAEILKGLKHKYLPRIYDVIENEDGYFYTVMDFIPGETLKDYVVRNGSVDQKTAYRWACQLCEVVAYLHAQSPAIIHSDIKPGNVMITPDGNICLIDFNTSMELRAGLTAIGKTKGYAAPEQYTKPEKVIRNMQAAAGLESPMVQNTILTPNDEASVEETVFVENTGSSGTDSFTQSPETANRFSLSALLFRSSALSTSATKGKGTSEYYGTVTRQTDIYAIGATLYFALTGMVPPHALEPARPLSTFRLPISRTMVQIIERAMEKNAKDRFVDAEEMGRAFREIHRLDGNYRKARLLTAIGILLETVLLVGGISLAVLGAKTLRQEQFNGYVALLNEAQQEKNQGDYADAIARTREAQRLMNERMEAYTEEAAVYFAQGMHAVGKEERSIYFKQCEDAVEGILLAENLTGGTAQEWAKAYFVGAESCLELGDYARAQKWYTKALEYEPSEGCYQGLICAYVFDGKMTEAKKTLREMQTHFSDADTKATAELIEAELCYIEADYDGAVEHYKELLNATTEETLLRRAYLEANSACWNAFLALGYEHGGEPFLMQSITFLEKACDRLPSEWETYKPLLAYSCYVKACNLEAEQRSAWLDKALAAYTAIEVVYLDREERLLVNEIRFERMLLMEAEEDLLKMQALYPREYRVVMWLTYIYRSQYQASYAQFKESVSSGNEQKARDDAKKVEEDWDKMMNLYQLARTLYEESGSVDKDMDVLIEKMEQLIAGGE